MRKLADDARDENNRLRAQALFESLPNRTGLQAAAQGDVSQDYVELYGRAEKTTNDPAAAYRLLVSAANRDPLHVYGFLDESTPTLDFAA